MKLFLTRHGQTVLNVQGITMGQLDSPLTQTGVAQASQKGEELADVSIDAIYSSDLGRCRRTAEEIRAHLPGDPPLNFLKELREIDFGIYQGKPYSDVPAKVGGYMKEPFPDGESNEMLTQRVVDAMNKIYKNNKDNTVLVVTHSGPVAVIMAAYSRATLDATLGQKIDNREVVELELNQPLAIAPDILN